MNTKIYILIISYICCSFVYGKTNFVFSPSLTNSSGFIKFKIEVERESFISLVSENTFFKVNYPFERPVNFRKIRSDFTGINEQSYFFLKNKENTFCFWFGRRYLQTGPGQISGLFISVQSPALDNIGYKYKISNNLEIESNIVRLDNRRFNEMLDGFYDSSYDVYYNRWYYYHQFNYVINEFIKVGFKEAVVSTGQDRSVEWYYLLPLGLFHAEQLHAESRSDGLEYTMDSPGMGNNDNSMLGLDLVVKLTDYSFYLEVLIDDFQIDNKDRKKMQDVFGFVVGFDLRATSLSLIGEYAYASPWLYLNRCKYCSPEINNNSLGLRMPNYQSLGIKLSYYLSGYKLGLLANMLQKGTQDLDTDWNAWGNKIDYFEFESFVYEIRAFASSKYKNTNYELGFSHNWMEDNTLQIYSKLSYQF